MGGSYPASSKPSWNFAGSGNPRLAAHVVNTWDGRVVFLGGDVGKHVLTGGPLLARGPEGDPVRRAYRLYGYGKPRPSWDPLAVWYAVYGLGGLFVVGNEGGRNFVEGDGGNRWVWEGENEGGRSGRQVFLRLAVGNETAAEVVDGLFLEGAWAAAKEEEWVKHEEKGGCWKCRHEEL